MLSHFAVQGVLHQFGIQELAIDAEAAGGFRAVSSSRLQGALQQYFLKAGDGGVVIELQEIFH